MNDYKELIATLRNYADTADENIYGLCVNSPKAMTQAADAIGQLVKERDAAIADLKDHGRNCKTCLHGGRGKNDCLDRKEVPCKWEWRGHTKKNSET